MVIPPLLYLKGFNEEESGNKELPQEFQVLINKMDEILPKYIGVWQINLWIHGRNDLKEKTKLKALLVMDLLKEYFKDRYKDCYELLCCYNEDTDLVIDDPTYHPLGEFEIIFQNDKYYIEITPIRIRFGDVSEPNLYYDLLNFYVLCGSCKDEKDNGSWDKAIKWLEDNIDN